MTKRENTVSFERATYDLNGYWLHLDSLHNLDQDMFFSPFKKYTCQAGCKVCYISKELDKSAAIIHEYAPVEITPAQEEIWNFWFSNFNEVGYSDDLVFVQRNFPAVYAWLKTNAIKFKYCMTDNSILRQHDLLINDIEFAGIMDIAISDQFLDTQPHMWKIIEQKLEELADKYYITQIKFLITRPGPYTRPIAKLIEWVENKKIAHLVHHDFTDEQNLKHKIATATNFNDWVMCQKGRLYEIQKETVQLFGDRWFFSSQDATSREPFWIMNNDNNQDMEELMYRMFEGKQHNYKNMFDSLEVDTTLSSKFKNYFSLVGTYSINRHYNFIPKMLLSTDSKFFENLVSNGWLNTENGLFKPTSDRVTSIIEPKRN
jgi:hypothetical protein